MRDIITAALGTTLFTIGSTAVTVGGAVTARDAKRAGINMYIKEWSVESGKYEEENQE